MGVTGNSGGPDIGQVDPALYPKRELKSLRGKRTAEFQVVIRQSVLNAIRRHGRSTTDVEICGVLVGNVIQDESGPLAYVEASIQGEHAGTQAAQVTFTAQTWSHIQHELDEKHLNKRIVGWYHTHPGFGIFLSSMDLFIHENFFDLPWQIAFVYDPLSGEEGMFTWQRGKPARDAFLVEEDMPAEECADEHPRATAAANLSPKIKRLEQRQRNQALGIVAVAVFALIWPLVVPSILALVPGRSAAPMRPSPSQTDQLQQTPELGGSMGHRYRTTPKPTNSTIDEPSAEGGNLPGNGPPEPVDVPSDSGERKKAPSEKSGSTTSRRTGKPAKNVAAERLAGRTSPTKQSESRETSSKESDLGEVAPQKIPPHQEEERPETARGNGENKEGELNAKESTAKSEAERQPSTGSED